MCVCVCTPFLWSGNSFFSSCPSLGTHVSQDLVTLVIWFALYRAQRPPEVLDKVVYSRSNPAKTRFWMFHDALEQHLYQSQTFPFMYSKKKHPFNSTSSTFCLAFLALLITWKLQGQSPFHSLPQHFREKAGHWQQWQPHRRPKEESWGRGGRTISQPFGE